MKNIYFRKPHATTKFTLIAVSKDEWGTQKRTLVSPLRTFCKYYDVQKGTSQAEEASNSEKNQDRKNNNAIFAHT